MDYSQKTADLIERMCRNVEREDFRLQKKKGAECVLKTYDLFGLERPKKVVWLKDVFGKFEDTAWSAGSAGSAGSAWSAWSARSAGSAWSAWSARSAGSAWSARSAWSAWSARSAGSAGSAGSAWSAGSAGSAWSARSAWSAKWTALDYDFDYYIFEFEYCENPTDDKPNKNDKIYLEYCDLLMQAKEYGVGYRVEWEDTLYLVPTPIVRIDERNRYHSVKEPAIRWKGGRECYFLQGIKFEKELWEKIANDTITAKEVFAIENTEERRVAYEMMDKVKMKDLNPKILSKAKDGKYDMKVVELEIDDITFRYLNCICPSTGREYYLETEEKSAKKAKAKSFGFETIKFEMEW